MTDEPPIVNYEYITHDYHKIQVESAVRDALGYRIDTAYPKKVDILVTPGAAKNLVIHHGLSNAPSAVSLYVVNHDTGAYEMVGADVTVTNTDILIKFIELPDSPDGQSLQLLVRSLI